MAPPKARLYNRTGRLKTINKSYTNSQGSSANNSNSSSNSNGNNVNNRNSGENYQRNRPNPPTTSTNSSGTQTDNSNSANGRTVSYPNISDSMVIQQFELELCWCIQTMEKSLESGNLSAKQAQDTDKTIRLLKSSNQPMVKKRQIMQTAFGDYRAKMADEEKRLRLGSRSIQFVDTIANTTAANNANKCHFVKKSLTASLGDKNFQFNFPVSEIEKLSIEHTTDTEANDDDHAVNKKIKGPVAAEIGTNDKVRSSSPKEISSSPSPPLASDIATSGPVINNASKLLNENNFSNSARCTKSNNQIMPISTKFTTSNNSFKFNFSID